VTALADQSKQVRSRDIVAIAHEVIGGAPRQWLAETTPAALTFLLRFIAAKKSPRWKRAPWHVPASRRVALLEFCFLSGHHEEDHCPAARRRHRCRKSRRDGGRQIMLPTNSRAANSSQEFARKPERRRSADVTFPAADAVFPGARTMVFYRWSVQKQNSSKPHARCRNMPRGAFSSVANFLAAINAIQKVRRPASFPQPLRGAPPNHFVRDGDNIPRAHLPLTGRPAPSPGYRLPQARHRSLRNPGPAATKRSALRPECFPSTIDRAGTPTDCGDMISYVSGFLIIPSW